MPIRRRRVRRRAKRIRLNLTENHILKPTRLLHRRSTDPWRRERLKRLHRRRGRQARCGDEEGGEGGGEVHYCCFCGVVDEA